MTSANTAERGSVLLLAIFVIALLASIGVGLLYMTQSGAKMGRADVRSKQSFYLAEAAVEEGRMALFAAGGGAAFNAALATAAQNAVFDFDPAALQATYDAGGNVTALTGYGDDVPLRPLSAFGSGVGVPGSFAAFLTNDPLEDDEVSDGNDRVMITGVGFGPGRSMEVVQAIVEHRVLTPVFPSSAITLLGPNPQFEGGSSGAKTYTGNDCDGSGVPGLHVAAIGTIGAAAEAAVEANVPDHSGLYRSGTERGDDTVVDLTDSSEPLLSGALDPTWTDCMALREMMAGVRSAANVVCTTDTCTLPPASPTRIVFVDGNYTSPDGEGLLAVTGKLVVNGAWRWTGVVLVVGTGNMVRDGGGNGEIHGTMIVANISGPDHLLFTDDDCTAGVDGFESPIFQTAGAGNSTVSYCQEAIDPLHIPLPFKIVDFRQR